MLLPFLLLHHQGQGYLAELACAVESSDANSAPALKRGVSSVSLTVVERVKWCLSLACCDRLSTSSSTMYTELTPQRVSCQNRKKNAHATRTRERLTRTDCARLSLRQQTRASFLIRCVLTVWIPGPAEP